MRGAGRSVRPFRVPMASHVADTTLADAGAARIAWADGQMPVLRSIRERFERDRPLDGIRVAACLHVTAETANLVRTLMAGGARTALAAANPLSTQDDTAAALVERFGAEVHAVRGEDADAYVANVAALAAGEPQVTIDDGADLITILHAAGDGSRARALLGGMEETTTGLVRVRALEAEGRLACPVLAVNEAHTERAFNDRYGTGQSTLDGILRATNLLLAGHTLVVLGYGWTGRGVAIRARGAGASVIVCEVDPLAALEARMEGFEVMPALDAAERGDVFVTVTGARDVLTRAHFERMKDGAVLANAGHFDVEISVPDLRALAAGGVREVRPLVEEYDLGGRRLNLLARGRVVNLAAAEGHPAAVMDMSFALQALCVEELVRRAGELAPGIHPVPSHIDREVAALKLAALGVRIDELTPEQAVYRRSWE
jgi:adenosylhomocysteinase